MHIKANSQYIQSKSQANLKQIQSKLKHSPYQGISSKFKLTSLNLIGAYFEFALNSKQAKTYKFEFALNFKQRQPYKFECPLLFKQIQTRKFEFAWDLLWCSVEFKTNSTLQVWFRFGSQAKSDLQVWVCLEFTLNFIWITIKLTLTSLILFEIQRNFKFMNLNLLWIYFEFIWISSKFKLTTLNVLWISNKFKLASLNFKQIQTCKDPESSMQYVYIYIYILYMAPLGTHIQIDTLDIHT